MQSWIPADFHYKIETVFLKEKEFSSWNVIKIALSIAENM